MGIRGEKQKTKKEKHYVCLNCGGCFYDDERGASACCNSSVEEQDHHTCVDCGLCRFGSYQDKYCSCNLNNTSGGVE